MVRRLWAAFSVAAIAFGMTALAFDADAQQRSYSRSANSGQSQWMDEYYGWNNDCSFKTINVDVVERPRNGSVSPRIRRSRIQQAQVGTATHCIGRPTRAVAVYYRSRKGFRGTDRFRVRMRVAGQPAVTFTYTVQVR